MLAQEGQEGLAPSAVYQQNLSHRETNWLVSALIYAVEKSRTYLWGRKFVLQTDYSPLQWLKNF